jgi:hypothetical protein
MVNGSLIMGSDAIGRNGIRRPIIRPIVVGPVFTPRITPVWGGSYQPSTPYQVGAPMNLAQLQQLAQSNPSALTPSQVQQLQAAGTIAGTVPPTSAGLINSSSAAIDPATGQTYASELAAAQALQTAGATTSTSSLGTTLGTVYAGLPLYVWLGIAAGGFFLMSNSGRRR